ncbi:MAG: PrgI family protein [Patescibacteria group bacterium]
MAVKIPQNIDKEDKLVGPLTLKQFLYVLGGAGVTFVAYQGYVQYYLFAHEFFIIAFIASAIALSFAFLKINGLPFITFINNLLAFLFVKRSRMWGKDNTLEKSAPLSKKEATPEETTSEIAPTKSELEKLATVLDAGGTINTDQTITAREINTLPANKKIDNSLIEQELGVEDIFEQTDI